MLGQLDEAEALLAALPAEIARHGAVDQARAAIALARDVKPLADLSAVEAKVAANPDDHEARFELAGGLMARLMKPAPDTAISAGAGAVRRSLSSASIRGP